MNVVTAAQIRELDRAAMQEAGIPGVVLMENAGRAVMDVLEQRHGPVEGRRVAVFCGAGNNGGDGFVIARLLALAGAAPTVFSAPPPADPARSKPDAAAHARVARWMSQVAFEELPAPAEIDSSRAWGRRFDLAVDAILGTGIRSAPEGWHAEAIRAINALGCPVLAVDVPSGIDSDTGATPGQAVRAATTVTLAFPKLGLFLHPAYELAGAIHIADIGFPWQSLMPDSGIRLLGCSRDRGRGGLSCSRSLTSAPSWVSLLEKRRPESNKGDYGHVAVVAGSHGMAGAPALVARAAQRAGAGLVTVLTPLSTQPIVAAKLDEQMTLALPELDGAVAASAWEQIKAFASRATLLAIGPGLTTAPETATLVQRLVREISLPIVLDADGLNALALDPEAARYRADHGGAELIVTPHPGEAARLLGTSIDAVQSDRIGAVRELARRYSATAVLKGRYTLIAGADGDVEINTTGNPGMATGGMGDTLTGVVAALAAGAYARARHAGRPMASGYAALAVHAHGIAGDLAAEELGEAGLTAGDVARHLPAALARLTDATGWI